MMIRKLRRAGERGNTLIVALVLTLTLGGLGGSYLLVSTAKQKMTAGEMDREKAFRAAEAGIAAAIFERNARRDYDANPNSPTYYDPNTYSSYLNPSTGLARTPIPANCGSCGTAGAPISFRDGSYYTTVHNDNGAGPIVAGVNGAVFTITAPATSSPNIRIVSTGTYRGISRHIQVIATEPPPPTVPPSTAGALAAVTTLGPVEVSGSNTIDGRDWDINGAAIVGAGTKGIVGGSSVSITGAGAVGGNGLAPTNGPPAGTVETTHNWAADGVDNDGDGVVDEAGEGFPQNPDEVFAQQHTPSTMKLTAQASGSYFTDYASYAAAAAAGTLGGKVVYVEVSGIQNPFELFPAMNATPSILIVWSPDGQPEAQMKNVHGDFKGMLVTQNFDHFNGVANVLGAVVTKGSLSNALSNGNSSVKFSSAVLANLPGVSPGGVTAQIYTFKQWMERGGHQ